MMNDKMIIYMRDYAMKIMPREIGYKKTIEWLANYKFPKAHEDLIKLSNIWQGLIQNALLDIDKPSKEELSKEEFIRTVPGILKSITFYKYYKKVGPSNVFKWLENYKFPKDYDNLYKTKKNWNNIISKLSNIKIHKKELYNDLARYYKDKSKTNYFKYKLLENYENYKNKMVSFWKL